MKTEELSLHDFRRAFALAMLRNGTDIYTSAKLMAKERILVRQRYLKQAYQVPETWQCRSRNLDNSEFSSSKCTGKIGRK